MMNENETVPVDNETASGDAAPPPPDDAPVEDAPAHGGEKHVPVSEARRYRKRAQAAESILADLQGELKAKDRLVHEQRQTISDLQHRREIDELLIETGALDLETARLLTELACQEMDEPNAARAVGDLQRRKPFLFRRGADGTGALSPRPEPPAAPEARLDHAAAEACATGRRQDLLRYLRLRRKR